MPKQKKNLQIGGGALESGGGGGCETKRKQLTRIGVHFEWNKGNQESERVRVFSELFFA